MPDRRPARIICLGGAVIDRKLIAIEPVRPGTSNPARGSIGFGGVARNVTENLARLGCEVGFLSCVGDDPSGRALLGHLAGLGVDVSGVRTVSGAATAEYVAILEPGGALHLAAADMAILDGLYGPLVADAVEAACGADWLFADCNASAEALAELIAHARRTGLALAIDVISTPKARRLPQDLRGLGCLFLNRDEASAILGLEDGEPESMAGALGRRGAARIVLTMGAEGALAWQGGSGVRIPAEAAGVVDVTGAGDAMIAGTLRGLCAGLDLPGAARLGAHVAARTVASSLSVSDALSPALADRFIAAAGASSARADARAP
ncbi:MAG: carbohydrate kinase [Bosea sp.]|jgi:pseudouridine kinase|nr:carbohydrate kinase [Bosea sp. (in: a-proteobacteria)]